jgi:hypothetical protein
LFALRSQLHTFHGFNPILAFILTLRKKVKVEITDEDGTTYSLALQGRFSHEKVLRMMELIDVIGQNGHISNQTAPDETTTYGRLLKLIHSSYSVKEFSSADVARDYEDRHGSPIPLSTVSTYLSRLADRGTLNRQKFGSSWVYRLSHLTTDHLTT